MRTLWFDPDLLQMEEAARITAVTVLSFASLTALASVAGLPKEGAWIGGTVAQYAAWFVIVPDHDRHLRLACGSLACGFLGAMAGVALAGHPDVLAVAAILLTAFALKARSANATTVALAGPYALVFAAYYDPDRGYLAWYAACIAVAACIYLVVRFVVWGRDRPQLTGTLVAVHRRVLEKLERVEKPGHRRLRRMHVTIVPIEERLSNGDGHHRRLARRLARVRVLTTAKALGTAKLARCRALRGGTLRREAAREVDLTAQGLRASPAPPPPAVGGTTGRAIAAPALLAMALVLPVAMWLSPERWA